MIVACNKPIKVPKRILRAKKHTEPKHAKKIARTDKQLFEQLKQMWDDVDDDDDIELFFS